MDIIFTNPSARTGYDTRSIFKRSLTGLNSGGARGVVIIVVGNEHGDTSSNPGRDWLHFT